MRMIMFQKLFDYIIPIVLGIVLLTFAIIGYLKAKNDVKKKKQNIFLLILGIILISLSMILMFL
jgi:TRAP-type uncharacterized transport system fused permease subunit